METPRYACHVQAILQLFQERRFGEAMEYLADLPPEVGLVLTPDRAPGEGDQSGTESWTGLPTAPWMSETPGTAAPPATPSPTGPSPTEPPEPHEVRRIRAALEQAQYRKGIAAELLGFSRTTLWRKMREYGL